MQSNRVKKLYLTNDRNIVTTYYKQHSIELFRSVRVLKRLIWIKNENYDKKPFYFHFFIETS